MSERAAAKAKIREAKERELAGRVKPLPRKRYGVIYADPPWRFEPWSRKTGMDRAADNHYPTLGTNFICAIPVEESCAANDAVLFLWATAPMLKDALLVMLNWGFEYKSHLVWNKQRKGLGYWFRNQHELLLVGTRGEVKCPAPDKRWPSLFTDEARLPHSMKPAVVYQLIESYFPTLPKIELFARGKPREGWEAWGNEVEA